MECTYFSYHFVQGEEKATPELISPIVAFKLPSHMTLHLSFTMTRTLLELISVRLPQAEFAFFSACHIVVGDLHGTPDEI